MRIRVLRANRFEAAMGNMVLAESPHIVSCPGLGSCVALILYDTSRKIGGVAHIMLPDANGIHALNRPYQYAGVATTFLLKRLQARGATRENIVAKMVGGASMFANDGGVEPTIGERNVISIRHILDEEGIPLVAKDVGGSYGRSIQLHLDSGKVTIMSIGKGSREI